MSMMSKFYDAYLREENTCSPERYAINDFLKDHMTNEGDIIEIDKLITMSEDKSTETAFAAGFKSAMMFFIEVLAHGKD